MKIIGVEGMSGDELNQELRAGGKFVVYQYCISVIVMTFRRSSNIYFIKNHESAVVKGLGYTLTSLLLGWWGIPWGLIYTPATIATNLGGGKNVTQEVIAALNQPAAPAPVPQ
ncbi:MAG TPA: hypothetical protein VGY53_02900 [Isosphaeraceae bacterium]|jgi:hypothetical protein|nr:hypothetical protein [Isosphaeraceae bacterium]